MFTLEGKIFKDLFLDIFWEVLYFPFWWYSRGFLKAVLFCWGQIKGGWRASALSIFFLNFFKPMYGERGFAAYFLSLMVRIWQIFWRIIFIIPWTAFWLFALCFWLALPILIIWQLIL